MKNFIQYSLPATISVTALSFIPLFAIRMVWIDVLLLTIGLTGVAFISSIIL